MAVHAWTAPAWQGVFGGCDSLDRRGHGSNLHGAVMGRQRTILAPIPINLLTALPISSAGLTTESQSDYASSGSQPVSTQGNPSQPPS